MQRFLNWLFALLLLIPLSSYSETADWRTQVAREAAKLERLYTLIVVHEGQEVLALDLKGTGLDTLTNIKSLSKTVLAAMVGIGIEKGVFEGIDQPVVETLGDRVPASATEGVERITLGHLLSLQAGLRRTSGQYYGPWVNSENWVHHVLTRPFVDAPGGRMLYSTGSSHLLSAALTESAGRSTLALAREWLGEPLNITIPAWGRDPQGIYFGGNNMLLSPRDLVKIGELYRNEGRIGDRRLFPEDWVRESWIERARSAYTDDPYGYGWFQQPLAGEMGYYGRGYGGQVLYVMPARQLTVVMTSDPTPPSPGSTFLRRQFRLIEDHIIPAMEN
ncbi:serine hydrolase domain-containing protein [Marinobacter salsuginis]|uniref:6-aminohexanoate-dimer hydrolase n=1 Tax=Marinobacter salsuginis TaxID=418719 RepID=A0A5M3PSC3_9GAMM|nr:serine hydrolase [Marinobacter salsuginis]GBO85686.1 6-aminohexanoate-dimer hydrolase [Marinobacter salsuginis]